MHFRRMRRARKLGLSLGFKEGCRAGQPTLKEEGSMLSIIEKTTNSNRKTKYMVILDSCLTGGEIL